MKGEPEVSLRQERVNKFLVQEISAIVRRMKDPRLGFVTFTEAQVSPDLRTARIGVSFLGDAEERQASFEVLKRAVGHIRRELLKVSHMRTTPMLELYLDDGPLKSARVQELLREIEDDQADI